MGRMCKTYGSSPRAQPVPTEPAAPFVSAIGVDVQQPAQTVVHHVQHAPVKRTCPKCRGLGGWGAFGVCDPSDVHYRYPCPCCKGNKMMPPMKKCTQCKGKGGLGAFGPCEPHDVHKRSDCSSCSGGGYIEEMSTEQQQGMHKASVMSQIRAQVPKRNNTRTYH